MEKIYTIGTDNTLVGLNYEHLSVAGLDENKLHSSVVSYFMSNSVTKIIIDMGSDPVLALKIGFHIRLSLGELKEKCFVPILFTSNASLLFIIKQSGEWAQLLSTKGVFFSDYGMTKKESEHMVGLDIMAYRTGFLNQIFVRPNEKIGRHSLANQWGAYIMDQIAGTKALENDQEILNAKASLYFKYVIALNFDLRLINAEAIYDLESKTGLAQKISIDAKHRKVLLIDDEADKGWEKVLRAIIHTNDPADFMVINRKVGRYSDFNQMEKHMLSSGDVDLFLVDLRLSGQQEEDVSSPNDLSGIKVLNTIKKANPGNQVLIFTASNKAWNLKAASSGELPADGYYIKESPEYNFSREFSQVNLSSLQEEVERCFDRDYLREVVELTKTIKIYQPSMLKKKKADKKGGLADLSNLKNGWEEGRHWEEIKLNLENIFYNLNSNLSERFNLSMLLLFRNYEILCEWFYCLDSLKFKDGGEDKKLIKKNAGNHFIAVQPTSSEMEAHHSTANKVCSIMFQKLSIKDYGKINGIMEFAKVRNNFLHPKKRYTKSKTTDMVLKENILDWLRLQAEVLTSI